MVGENPENFVLLTRLYYARLENVRARIRLGHQKVIQRPEGFFILHEGKKINTGGS